MQQKIKVLILINELLRGGAQRIVLDIAKNIDTSRFDLRIVYLKSHSNFPSDSKTVLDEIIATGIPVTCLQGSKRVSLSEVWRLYTVLRKERPYILHAVLPYAGILGRIVGRLAGVRRIVSLQCNLPVAYAPRIYWLDKITLPLGTLWTAATQGIELSYGGSVQTFSEAAWHNGRRHFTIVAGVDLPVLDATIARSDKNIKRHELGIPADAKIIMMTARLISWKGHADLIQALTLLPQNTHLVLVGWGPLEAALREQARTNGLETRVHFLGARSDVLELLPVADVYVQAHCAAPDGKIWMGPNTSQMEACAAHIPSVSTAVPLIESLIQDGVTGILAKPNNPQDLARAIHYIFDNPRKAAIMSQAARRQVEEQYSIASMVKNYESLYATII